MGVEGRRIPVELGLGALERPGEYLGPTTEYTGERPAVFFLLPVSEERRAKEPGLRSLHHVTSPPHRFRECPDGSLEIRESIGASVGPHPQGSYAWHGYLDEGHHWREV